MPLPAMLGILGTVNSAIRTLLDAPRLTSALLGARLAARASGLAGRGATSLPGLVALRIRPGVAGVLARQLGQGVVLVAGTNGKTTTAGLLAAALRADDRRVLHNRAGSNMLRGVASTLIAEADWRGRVHERRDLTGLFETDEAALPAIVAQTRPRLVVLTNLFRDQLDRYGELQGIADLWRPYLAGMGSGSTLVLNADDPLVASLGEGAPGEVLYFGVERWPDDGQEAAAVLPVSSADSLFCPRCDAPLRFSQLAYAHLGHYACTRCAYARPSPRVAGRVLRTGASGSVLAVSIGAGLAEPFAETVEIALALPGRYNVYNALAALAAATATGVAPRIAAAALAGVEGAFGRAETIAVDGRSVGIFLIKNPTGADAVLEVLAEGDTAAGLLALLSDNAADGHDISWIWDADFERLDDWRGPIFCGGSRAEDMALRLKYAGLPAPAWMQGDDVGAAVRRAVAATPVGGTLRIVATYTAMLAARDALAKAGHVRQYWRQPA